MLATRASVDVAFPLCALCRRIVLILSNEKLTGCSERPTVINSNNCNVVEVDVRITVATIFNAHKVVVVPVGKVAIDEKLDDFFVANVSI